MNAPVHAIEDIGPWAAFLGGRWQRERPSLPGIYPTAGRDGGVCDYEKWVRLVPHAVREGALVQTGLKHGEPGWQGWYWSRPLPPLVRAPEAW